MAARQVPISREIDQLRKAQPVLFFEDLFAGDTLCELLALVVAADGIAALEAHLHQDFKTDAERLA